MSGERLSVPGEVDEWPYEFTMDGVDLVIERPSPVWIHERMDENRQRDGTFSIHNVLTSIYSKTVKAVGEEDLPYGNLENMGMDEYPFFKQFFTRFFINPIREASHPDVPAEIEEWPHEFTSAGVELMLNEPNPAWVQKQQDDADTTIELFRRCYEHLIVPVGGGASDRPDLAASWDHYQLINTYLGRFVVGPLVRST